MCEELIDNNSYEDVPMEWLDGDSYTVSYNLDLRVPEEERGWVSFHDYIPDYSICLRNEQLFHFYNGQLYEHNVGFKGIFFGESYSSIITPTIAPRVKDREKALYPFVIKSINWNTDIEDNRRRLLQETWSSVSLHNSFQGTRQIPLIVFDKECGLLQQYGKFNTKRVKNRWYYNYFFNEKNSSYTRTWNEHKDKFFVLNTMNKDCTQEELYRARLFDDFVIIRLVFNNDLNKKLFHYEISMDFVIVNQ